MGKGYHVPVERRSNGSKTKSSLSPIEYVEGFYLRRTDAVPTQTRNPLVKKVVPNSAGHTCRAKTEPRLRRDRGAENERVRPFLKFDFCLCAVLDYGDLRNMNDGRMKSGQGAMTLLLSGSGRVYASHHALRLLVDDFAVALSSGTPGSLTTHLSAPR